MPAEGTGLEEPSGDDRELISKAMEERDDLKVSRAMVKLSRLQLDAAWMEFLPTLNASWQLTDRFTVPGAFGSQDRTRWNALLTLSVPIYNQGRYFDLDHKRALAKMASIQVAEAMQQAQLEVRKTRRSYYSAVDQLATMEQQVALSREELALAQSEYENGTGSSLEVTSASRLSRQDEVSLALKRFEVQGAILKLLRALGQDMGDLK